MQTTPDPSLESNRRMWQVITSVLLSLTPLVALRLELAMPYTGLYGTVALVLSVVLYVGGYIGGVGAVVAGVRALRRDRLHPPLPPVVRAAAWVGIVIGIVGILLLVLAGVSLALLFHVCSIEPAECS